MFSASTKRPTARPIGVSGGAAGPWANAPVEMVKMNHSKARRNLFILDLTTQMRPRPRTGPRFHVL